VIPGHEFGGTVVATGADVEWLEVGDRVVVDPSRSCEHCPQCLAGRRNLCPNKGGYGSRFPGGFAPRAAVRAISCVKVPDGMAWEVALLAEPLSCVLHGMDRLGDAAGDDAIVVGAGPIGLLTALVLRHVGTVVAVVERSVHRRGIAEKLGFERVGESVGELGWSDAAVVVDATGVPQAVEEGFSMLRRGGSLLLMGVAKAGSIISLDPHRLNWQELTVLGSTAVNASFGRAVDMLSRLGGQTEPIVTHNVRLENFDEGLELVKSQGALKVLVRP
jgi:NADPH2:quinone reductase